MRYVSGTKSIPEHMVMHVSGIVRDIVVKEFADNQRAAARALKISQPQISDLYNAKAGKGIGLPTLLALRNHTKKSLDELLGLSGVAALTDAQLLDHLRSAVIEATVRGLIRIPSEAPQAPPALQASPADHIRAVLLMRGKRPTPSEEEIAWVIDHPPRALSEKSIWERVGKASAVLASSKDARTRKAARAAHTKPTRESAPPPADTAPRRRRSAG